MNTDKVKSIIATIVADTQRKYRKQYASAVWQDTKLKELGIFDLMPKGFRHSDADAVLKAAQQGEGYTGGFDAYGEGYDVRIDAHPLYQAMNEVEVVEEPAVVASSAEVAATSTRTVRQPKTTSATGIVNTDVYSKDGIELTVEAWELVAALDAREQAKANIYNTETEQTEIYLDMVAGAAYEGEKESDVAEAKRLIKLGKELFEQGYRIKSSEKRQLGCLHSYLLPDEAIAWCVAFAGYIAAHEQERYVYVIKKS